MQVLILKSRRLSRSCLDVPGYAARAGAGFVFPGENPKRPVAMTAMDALLERMGRTDTSPSRIPFDGPRLAGGTTNYAGAVTETALGHILGDKVKAAYRRGDLFEKCRKPMAAWATYRTTPSNRFDVIPIGPRVSAVNQKFCEATRQTSTT